MAASLATRAARGVERAAWTSGVMRPASARPSSSLSRRRVEPSARRSWTRRSRLSFTPAVQPRRMRAAISRGCFPVSFTGQLLEAGEAANGARRGAVGIDDADGGLRAAGENLVAAVADRVAGQDRLVPADHHGLAG